jgi:hypothetical protein
VTSSSLPLPSGRWSRGERRNPFRDIRNVTEWVPDIPFSLRSKENSGMTPRRLPAPNGASPQQAHHRRFFIDLVSASA